MLSAPWRLRARWPFDNARAIEQRRSQLAVAQRGVEQAAIDLSLVLRDAAGQPIVGSTDMGRALPSRPDLSQPVLELSLFVDVPLQARVMQGRVSAAQAQANRARLHLGYARDTIASEVQDAFSALRVSRERIEAARNEVAAARELEEGERIRFEHGDSQLLIVNLREQPTAEARLREVEALLDHQRAQVMLKAARGELR